MCSGATRYVWRVLFDDGVAIAGSKTRPVSRRPVISNVLPLEQPPQCCLPGGGQLFVPQLERRSRLGAAASTTNLNQPILRGLILAALLGSESPTHGSDHGPVDYPNASGLFTCRVVSSSWGQDYVVCVACCKRAGSCFLLPRMPGGKLCCDFPCPETSRMSQRAKPWGQFVTAPSTAV